MLHSNISTHNHQFCGQFDGESGYMHLTICHLYVERLMTGDSHGGDICDVLS